MGATVVEHPRGSGKWHLVTSREGKRRWRYVGTGPEARAAALEAAAAVRRQQELEALGVAPVLVSVAVEQHVRRYRASWKPSYRETAEGYQRLHLEPRLGMADLRTLTDADLAAYIDGILASGRSLAVARGSLSLLRAVASRLHHEGRLARNPMAGVGRLLAGYRRATAGDSEVRRDSWTAGELATLLRLAAAHEAPYAAFFVAAAHTGARLGELLGLRWDSVDFARGEVRVRRSLVRGVLGTTKTHRARSVPMSADLRDALLRLRAASLNSIGRDPDGPVFHAATGHPLSRDRAELVWRRLRERAAREGVRPLPFHCFRHTFASLALAAGRDPITVASWTGHSPEVLLRHYAHAIPREGEAMEFLASRPVRLARGEGERNGQF